MKDYYGIFGLPFCAPKEAVEAACRRVVERRGSGEVLSRDVREAYKVLCSDATRAEYDAAYASAGGSGQESNVFAGREESGPTHDGACAAPLPDVSEERLSGKSDRRGSEVIRRVRAAGSVRSGSGSRSGKRSAFILPVLYVIVSIIVAGAFLSFRYVEREREEAFQDGLDKFSQGEFHEASELLEAGDAEESDDPSVLLKLGASYYNQREYDDAVSAYEKAISLGGQDAMAYNSLGNAYRDKKESDRAIEMYRKSIETDPKFPLAYSNLAILLMDSGDREAAKLVVSEGLSSIPDSQELKNIGTYIGE